LFEKNILPPIIYNRNNISDGLIAKEKIVMKKIIMLPERLKTAFWKNCSSPRINFRKKSIKCQNNAFHQNKSKREKRGQAPKSDNR